MTASAPTVLALIRATAQDVATAHADLEMAAADQRGAKAEFLDRVLEAIRPAARSLGGPVAVASTSSPAGTTVTPAGWRGLYLAGLGPTLVNRTLVEQPGYARSAWPERGRHAGARLVLRDDGTLAELVYDGPWSNVPGETASWKAAVTPLDPSEAVARGYKVEEILEAIGVALQAQADGKATQRAAELRGKASRLREFAKLLRGL